MAKFTKYLESQSKSGGKYWEIEVEGQTQRVRYGKMGQDKSWSEKEFESEEAAQKDADKRIQQKLKKGYVDPSTISLAPEPTLRVLPFDEVRQIVGKPLEQLELNYDSVLLIEGEFRITGDFCARVDGVDQDVSLICVHGDLHVDGRVRFEEDFPALLVTGETYAETIENGDCELYIAGGDIKYFIYGFHNRGMMETKAKAAYVINDGEHNMFCNLDEAIGIHFSYEDGYDYEGDKIASAFISDVLTEAEDEDDRVIDIEKFYQHLKAGKKVLKDDAMSKTEEVSLEIATSLKDATTDLNLAGTQLKAFPPEVFDNTSLKTLCIGANRIETIPPEIAKLENLEELDMSWMGLSSLPEEIGELKKLRKLDLSHQHVQLSSALGNLHSLNEINLSHLSTAVDDENGRRYSKVELPASIARLTKLRTIEAQHTNLVFPHEMHGMQSIEEIDLTRFTYLNRQDFPMVLCSFTNLRRLLLAENLFTSIPNELLNLVQLEELDLSNSLSKLEKIPDLSSLTKLRVLNAKESNPRVSPQGPPVLRQILEMKLPNLEELNVSGWRGVNLLPEESFRNLGSFTNLRRLDFSRCNLNRVPRAIQNLKKLEYLDFSRNKLSEEDCDWLQRNFSDAVLL